MIPIDNEFKNDYSHCTYELHTAHINLDGLHDNKTSRMQIASESNAHARVVSEQVNSNTRKKGRIGRKIYHALSYNCTAKTNSIITIEMQACINLCTECFTIKNFKKSKINRKSRKQLVLVTKYVGNIKFFLFFMFSIRKIFKNPLEAPRRRAIIIIIK